MSDDPNHKEDMKDADDGAVSADEGAVETHSVEDAAARYSQEVDSGQLRLLEAVLFSASEPQSKESLVERLPDGADVYQLLSSLAAHYENHGINLVTAGGRWFFRNAEDLSEELRVHKTVQRRLSRAAMETLAIIAYHQPVTRAEIEEVRGVGLSRGTLDLLLEAGWIGPKGRRRTAGRPTTWGTTTGFLVEFGIETIEDLAGLDDLKAAGLLDKRPAMQIGEFATAPDASDDSDEERSLEEKTLSDLEDDSLFEGGVDGEAQVQGEEQSAIGGADEEAVVSDDPEGGVGKALSGKPESK
jgi:segregation and condensation protein B